MAFDRASLLRRLRGTDPRSMTAFAAVTAERFVRGLREHPSVDDALLRVLDEHSKALDQLWQDLAQSTPDREGLQVLADHVLARIPHEDEPGVDWLAEAQEAGAVVVYAIESRRTDDAEQASWAVQAIYDYLDGFVIARDDRDIAEPNLTADVLLDPVIQQELRREARDLDEWLQGLAVDASLLQHARARAKYEAATFFAPPSCEPR